MVGIAEMLIVLMSGAIFSGGDFLGIPPGERDPRLAAAAPADAAIYFEWAERGQGTPGGDGVDGLVADPEFILFRDTVITSIRTMIDRESKSGPPEAQIAGQVVPNLILNLVNQPGSVSVSFDPTRIEQPEGGPPNWLNIVQAIDVTIILNAGENADEVAAGVEKLMDLLPPDLRQTGLDRRNLPIPAPIPGLTLQLHREGNYFIVAFGQGALEKAIAGLQGDGPGMNGNQRFTQALEKVQFKRTGSIAWIDTRQIMDKTTVMLGLQGAMVQGLLSLTGVGDIDSLITVGGVVDGQISSQCLLTTGGSLKGILSLAAGRALTTDDFALIPADADLVAAFSFDPLKVYQEARRIVQTADPGSVETMDQLIQQLESELGISLTEDVPAAFGHVWTIYDSPQSGGVFFTSAVVSLEVKDAEQAYTIFSQLMKILQNTMDSPDTSDNGGSSRRRRAVFLQSAKFLDRSIYYVNSVGSDIPFAPSFCCTDKQLLVALHPQALKAHLRFLADRGDTYEVELPENGETISLCEYDAQTLIRYGYALAPYFGQVAFSEMQREGFEGLDIFALPSARAILPYCKNSRSVAVRTEDGILTTASNAIPVPGLGSVVSQLPAFLGGAMFTLTRSIRMLGGADVPLPQGVLPPAAAAPRIRAVPAVPAEVIRRANPNLRRPAARTILPKTNAAPAKAPSAKTAQPQPKPEAAPAAKDE